jgi:hypothetical protein
MSKPLHTQIANVLEPVGGARKCNLTRQEREANAETSVADSATQAKAAEERLGEAYGSIQCKCTQWEEQRGV